MNRFPIIRVVSKFMIPYILLFGLYVQFHGDFGPGGGFQAGVIFASAIILYGLVYGLTAAQEVAPAWLIEKLIAVGLVIYAATGFLCMFLGGEEGKFLDYNVLEPHWGDQLPHGQHLGIFLVELGVGITVTAVMVMIYYAFAGRERTA